MKKKLEDTAFIFIAGLSTILAYYTYSLRGLAMLTWAFFLPLYLLQKAKRKI